MARTARYALMMGLLGLPLVAGCGGGGTPSGNFSLGGGGTTGSGTAMLSGFVLTATARSAANSLTWTTPAVTNTAAPTAVTYDISRATGASGALATLATGVGNSQYTDTDVQVGTTYKYQITAHAGGLTSSSNTDSATVGGPTTVGVGDPATNTPPGSPLFTAANFQYASQPSGGRLTLDVTLSHAAGVSDLRTVEVGGNVYIPTAGVTVSGNHLLIDSLAAGIPVPALTAGQYAGVTVTVGNTTANPVVPNAGRLELTGRAPTSGRTETDGPTGFQITISLGGA